LREYVDWNKVVKKTIPRYDFVKLAIKILFTHKREFSFITWITIHCHNPISLNWFVHYLTRLYLTKERRRWVNNLRYCTTRNYR